MAMCPARSDMKIDVECVGQKCAWFNAAQDECSVLTSAKRIEGIDENLGSTRHEVKELDDKTAESLGNIQATLKHMWDGILKR